MMDGRVKTLHPAIHGALLGLRENEEHLRAMQQHNITPIDLVCVNLYPFEKTMLAEGITREEVIEQIDIGGPSMLRSAAKNFRYVTVVTNPGQYDRVINELRTNDGNTTMELRHDLAAAAFMRTAEYDTAISSWMGTRRPESYPSMLRLSYAKQHELRYGENPHQSAAVYANPASPEPSVVNSRQLHGKPLSYNNLHDAAAALEAVQELHEVFPDQTGVAIIKHANPCGMSVAASPAAAFDLAYASDPLAAYGGILACNRPIDLATAERIIADQKFFEVIVAPDFENEAAALLGERWKNVRLLATDAIEHSGNRKLNYKSIPGGMLVQERDMKIARPTSWTHAAGPDPDEQLLNEAAFIWTAVKHLKSNAVAIGRGMQLVGGGMGQVDRVMACRTAILRAGDRMGETGRPLIAASDAFFPFADGPELLIEAGISCIVHPGGSMRDQDTIDLCNERNVTCLLTGVRHFRH
ncbi:MAG: bifunctional phosphoribosylaminoimidazolecarboxamide formyltransferase/IMP cyclohydrolase PurH [Phycisphaerales bacterium]|nr:MAG: bifunctional phosphoribosylaminoimidazolecarboxamide formyltransferase/IMP cyclohydrolase PurH [Phycisphaerales bacterium]